MLFREQLCCSEGPKLQSTAGFSHLSCSEVIETLSEHPTPSSFTLVKNQTCGEAATGLALEFVTTRAEFSSQLLFRTLPPTLSMFGEKPLLSRRERKLDRPFKTETCLRAVLLSCPAPLAHVFAHRSDAQLLPVLQRRGCPDQSRAQLSCVLYKHMKGHGPSPEVLEVVSKSHRHFLI